ncbi:efflux RND transporter periplasmic adaptor subunit [Aeoliella sp. SH292]|uniref:efflux RND transporter periplasmic adaptor subunit n=1 Tax=Aeoliella sp. SH292 TaxID=3454464 RepID=UPI003F987601
MNASAKLIPAVLLAVCCLALPGCDHSVAEEHAHHEARKVTATNPVAKNVNTKQQYVCQIHSCRHIEVKALESGYLESIPMKEGQVVRQGELMFSILPTLYQARLEAEQAEMQLAEIELGNTQKLFDDGVVSDKEVALAKAKLARAHAQLSLAQAEFNFTQVKAPFSGIIDRLMNQQGSLIEEGDILTTLSDNSVMWVYFNVPEARYLEYQRQLSEPGGSNNGLQVQLELADGSTFNQPGVIGAIEADFNNETGNIAFRADFPNPEGLLRHGQTGTVLINRLVENAIVIPQRATFEILAKKYVFVIGDDHVVHQREIKILNEMDDVYLIESGLAVNDKIVLEGIRQVRDGEHVEFEYRNPEEVLANLKYKAE